MWKSLARTEYSSTGGTQQVHSGGESHMVICIPNIKHGAGAYLKTLFDFGYFLYSIIAQNDLLIITR